MFEFLTSGLGITAFISLVTLMLPSKTIDSCLSVEERKIRVEENDKKYKKRRICALILLVFVLIITTIRYFGTFNIEDVFNGNFKYVGQTLNGKADGHGQKYTLKDSLIYDGNFVANSFDGKGKYYFYYTLDDGGEVTKLRYDGEFRAGLYEGRGNQYYANQADEVPVLKYEGNFVRGEYSGKGKLYYYVDNNEHKALYISETYDCEWKNGIKEGVGEYTKYNDKQDIIEHYKGSFENDLYEGVGTWEFIGENYNYYQGKFVFQGLFKNGSIVEGVYYDLNGNVIDVYGGAKEKLIKEYTFPDETVWIE